MNDLIAILIEIKKDLSALGEQLEGAKGMINENSPHYAYFKHLQRVIFGMHDKLAFQIKISKDKSPALNCS